MGKKGSGSGNQRANAHNPNNAAYSAAQNNRSRQLNPTDGRYRQSRELPLPGPKKER